MKHILVIDDSPEIRNILKEILEMEGYHVSIAEGCEEALGLHDESPVDLVITDICMPVKSGIETIEEFRTVSPDLKIIAISGGPGTAKAKGKTIYDDMLESAGKVGADKTLAKPFERKAIVQLVQELI